MCGASIAFCVMASLIKFASDVSPLKIVLFRFIIGMALLGLAALFGRIKLQFVRSPLLALRGILGGTAVFIFYLSIHKIGVGKGTIFTYSYPIFASIFSALFLKENIKMIKWLFIVLAFCGIFILATGGSNGSITLLSIGIWEMLAVAGAVLAGISVVIIKRLHESEDTYAIFFSQCLFGFWLFVIPANVTGSFGGYSEGMLLLSIGLVAAAGQLLMTEGYRHINVTTGALLNMLVPVLNFFVALAIFNEILTLKEILGSVLIVLSCIMVISSDGLFSSIGKVKS
jgi:drug/metabolite transporter (DMT)-like permease